MPVRHPIRFTLPVLALTLWLVACSASPSVSPNPSPTRSPSPTPSPSATSAPIPTARPAPIPTATASLPATPGPIDLGGDASPTPTSRAPAAGLAPSGQTQRATVARVVDGDTIRVLLDGQEYALRYIGIDTPETVHPSRPVEWMGREASEANRALVVGRAVVLERDVSETDRFGRLLRYVWLEQDGGWLLVNLELVRLGLAQVSTYPPDVKYTDIFLEAQREARNAGRGLWGEAPPEEGSAGRGNGSGGTGRPSSPGSACDPAYPTVCIPPPPPDLDCGDIPHRRFTVLSPDPHRFDGDRDGLGCEGG